MFAKRMIQLAMVSVLLVSSFAAVHGVSAQGYCGNTYVVQPGDWLSKIANRCGVNLSQVYGANPGVGRYIYPGQVIYINGGYNNGGWSNNGYNNSGPVPGNGGNWQGNNGNWQGNNGYWQGNKGFTGYSSGYSYCGPTSSTYYGNYYVVCRGDTLARIARYYGESVSYLQWHNHIYNANRIYAGQFIFP